MSIEILNEAILIYLGGNPCDGGILVGGIVRELERRFGDQANGIKTLIDEIFSQALGHAQGVIRGTTKGTVYDWLTEKYPELSHFARLKLESKVIYYIEH
ncbi:MAG: hypothetical protein KF851_16365 [Pirellulaceae bacterium]|nr:hypothetical protein [Pirellulaceae bacterium]